MSTEQEEDPNIQRACAKLESGFQGDEDIEEGSTPQKDLVAAVAIAIFAVFVGVLSVQLPNPGRTASAPAMLPLITAGALLVMAFFLALGAIRSGGTRDLASIIRGAQSADDDPSRRWRTAILIALLLGMVIAIDTVSFLVRMPVMGFELRLTGFELVAIPGIAIIFKIFWRVSWLRCIVVAVLGVLLLAAAFRYGFKIPLPGRD